MATFSIAGRATVAGTSARAIASLFSISSRSFRVIEIGVTNTTSTALVVALARFTSATNVGTGLTEVAWDEEGPAVAATGFAGHTADGSGVGSPFGQASIGAAVGSGTIWTFGGRGIRIATGTSSGVGIIIPTGTGQILDYWFHWEE